MSGTAGIFNVLKTKSSFPSTAKVWHNTQKTPVEKNWTDTQKRWTHSEAVNHTTEWAGYIRQQRITLYAVEKIIGQN